MRKLNFHQSAVVIALLAFTVSCKLLSSEAKLTSEAADSSPRTTVNSGIVTLNSEPLGSLADLKPFASKVEEIARLRESNGVFIAGTNEVENSILIAAKSELSVGKLDELMDTIRKSHANGYIPRPVGSYKPRENQRPNPLTLVASVDGASIDNELIEGFYNAYTSKLPVIDARREYVYSVYFETLEDTRDLLLKRMPYKVGIELGADDKLWLNEPFNEQLKCEPTNSNVKQRPLTEEELKTSVGEMIKPGDTLNIIASDKASYGALVNLLEIIRDRAPIATVHVRRDGLKKFERKLALCDLF